MTITTIQKIIKIGDSAGITLPAKDLKRAGLKPGQEVEVSFKSVEVSSDIDTEYEAFKSQYGETLKNLADR